MNSVIDIQFPDFDTRDREERWNLMRYAGQCVKDASIKRETPFQTYLFLQHRKVLNFGEEDWGREEKIKEIRIKLNIRTIIYEDLGITKKMQEKIGLAIEEGREVEYRKIRQENT